MYEPIVSIITPTYNIIENELDDDFYLQIRLLAKQTYDYIEHIVMDNNSDDGTIDLLKEYKNAESLTFYTSPDNGKYDAMNKGIMRAKGKYLLFLSADDIIHDVRAIEDLVIFMEEEDLDFCCFPTYCIESPEFAFLHEPQLLNVFQVAPCARQAVIYRKNSINEIGNFDSKFQLLADYDLLIRLMLNDYSGTVFDRPLITYKLGKNVIKYTVQTNAECNHIFYKNYKNLYPLDDEVLDRMVEVSEIPQELLEIFANKFPDEFNEEFYQKYLEMYNLRFEAYKQNQRKRR